MKRFLLSILPVLSMATGLQAATTNILFGWDPAPEATGYKFYEIVGTNRILLGGTPGLTFPVSNWGVGASRTMTVTGTNLWPGWETPEAIPYRVPALATNAPGNLRPTGFSLTMPVPGILE